ncbi:hypothetical protein [Phaeobacter sp. C3_T13_0]|uniref:hypothetical protein n=1 Tax=Phaeobacter cretensis TaxID=3342641 RepID=UPI0039BCCF54
MQIIRILAFLTASVSVSSVANTEDTLQSNKGFEAREIARLSEQDIDALRNGAGWSLALPAELNGFPGPSHVL